MVDVTDLAFRQMFVRYGKPDVLWTEFVAADGLAHKLARQKLSHMLERRPNESPIVAQIFGANPDNIKIACQYVASLGFDGIDINMGCPDKSVVAQGAGAGLIKNPKLARKIIQAAHEGIRATGRHLPVSVKTRVGFNQEEIDKWIPELIKEDIQALTIHARTKKEMSLVPANWNLVKRVVEIVKKSGKDIVVIGNGDVKSLAEGLARAQETNCDGIMVGRGAFGNPYFFNPNKQVLTQDEKLELALEHTRQFEKLVGSYQNFAVMKKHFKAYINDFDGAKELRIKLMETESYAEVHKIISSHIRK